MAFGSSPYSSLTVPLEDEVDLDDCYAARIQDAQPDGNQQELVVAHNLLVKFEGQKGPIRCKPGSYTIAINTVIL